MLPLRYQLVGHLLVGLLVGYLLRLALTPAGSEIERKSEPFTTQSGMLAVTLVLHRDAPPEIVEVRPLAQGRISVAQPGEYTLALQDVQGQTLYALPFRAVFLQPGDPPRPANDVRRIFVVPAGRDAARIVITGPQGSATRELSR
jgi:hypothetical protein